jgi:hypothetical protein
MKCLFPLYDVSNHNTVQVSRNLPTLVAKLARVLFCREMRHLSSSMSDVTPEKRTLLLSVPSVGSRAYFVRYEVTVYHIYTRTHTVPTDISHLTKTRDNSHALHKYLHQSKFSNWWNADIAKCLSTARSMNMNVGQWLHRFQTAVGFAITLLKSKWNSHWVWRWTEPLARSGCDRE